MGDLEKLLRAQQELQEYQKDGNPFLFTDEELRAQFITWNHTALVLELSECMEEIGWKPWATNRDIDVDRALKELVDAFHFFMNMMLAIASADAPKFPDTESLAKWFFQKYFEKHQINIQRQLSGYDGKKEKCPQCHRDLKEVALWNLWTKEGVEYCSRECANAEAI